MKTALFISSENVAYFYKVLIESNQEFDILKISYIPSGQVWVRMSLNFKEG